MDSLARSDVFFVVTTMAVIVLSVLFVVILVYVVKIVRDVRRISKTVSEETRRVVSDVESIRKALTVDSSKIKTAASYFAKKAVGAVESRFTSKDKKKDDGEEKKEA